jgi:hypothetical protein
MTQEPKKMFRRKRNFALDLFARLSPKQSERFRAAPALDEWEDWEDFPITSSMDPISSSMCPPEANGMTIEERGKMQAIAEWHGLPLEVEDEAAEVIDQIRTHIPHVPNDEIETLFEWIRMVRETGARPMPMA